MSTTRGVLAQSPEPEAHDKVLDNNPDRIGIGIYATVCCAEAVLMLKRYIYYIIVIVKQQTTQMDKKNASTGSDRVKP